VVTGCICHTGIGARLAPHIFAQKYEDERRRAHDTDMERIMSTGMGPHNPGNAEQQVLQQDCVSVLLSRLIGWPSSADDAYASTASSADVTARKSTAGSTLTCRVCSAGAPHRRRVAAVGRSGSDALGRGEEAPVGGRDHAVHPPPVAPAGALPEPATPPAVRRPFICPRC